LAKLEMTKSIEARKLNKRTRQLLAEHPITIPYGGILDEITDNGDIVSFHYLGEYYQCRSEILRSASHVLDGGAGTAPAESGAAAASTARPDPVSFVFEKLRGGTESVSRAKLPGGWLISVGEGAARSVAFYPDPEHQWDGTTL
jgi:hypothetical protein